MLCALGVFACTQAKSNTKHPTQEVQVSEDIKKKWEALKEKDLQAYQIVREGGTEAPFTNAFNDHKEEGIYVDVISGRPLFSSTHKFDSGSGWPSFYDVIDPKHIQTQEDRKLIRSRTEVHSADQTHLGHVFNDGPKEKTGLRYCVNSKSLAFIPKNKMKDPTYNGQFDALYERFFGTD